MGLEKSASLKPTARNIERFGLRSTPAVIFELRSMGQEIYRKGRKERKGKKATKPFTTEGTEAHRGILICEKAMAKATAKPFYHRGHRGILICEKTAKPF